MNLSLGDIDIDVKNRNDVIMLLDYIPAARYTDDGIKKHLTGIYVQDIPVSKYGYADFDHKDEVSYQKIDILNLGVLDQFITNNQLYELIDLEPDWNLLKDKMFVESLPHIHKWYDLISKKNVDSIDKLAMFLGIIRPGKEHLRNSTWDKIKKDIWIETEKYTFKKSHAYSYALTIVALMNKNTGKK